MWPKFCADHQEVKVLWCLECCIPVCQGCALGQGGAHCSHITSRPGQSGAVATRTALSRRAVGYWGPRTNLLGKMVGAMDGGVRLIWGTGEAEGMAWLEGTHGAVVQLKLAMKKEMKEQEARKGKGGGGPGEELGSGGRGSGGTLGSGKSGKRKSRRARGGPAGGPAGGSTGGATRGATGGASGATGGATETSIQSKLPECPVRIRRKKISFLSSKFFRFVLNSSAESLRSTSAIWGTLCVETADPGSGLVQAAGAVSLGDVTGLRNFSRFWRTEG